MNLAEQLRQAIENSDRSIYAIAKEAGMTQIQVARFMRHERDLTLKSASKICKVLGLDLQQKGEDSGNQ